MANLMTKERKEAHYALEGWAAFKILTINSGELGYQQCEWTIRVQTPPRALIPRITYTPYKVQIIDNWYDLASGDLKERAINIYLAEKSQQQPYTWKQQRKLLDKVYNFMVGN